MALKTSLRRISDTFHILDKDLGIDAKIPVKHLGYFKVQLGNAEQFLTENEAAPAKSANRPGPKPGKKAVAAAAAKTAPAAEAKTEPAKGKAGRPPKSPDEQAAAEARKKLPGFSRAALGEFFGERKGAPAKIPEIVAWGMKKFPGKYTTESDAAKSLSILATHGAVKIEGDSVTFLPQAAA